MARLFTSGFEVASNTDGEEWANVVTPGARSTATFRSGAASGQVTGFTSTAQCGYGVQFVSALSNGPYFLRFYFRVDTLPSAANTICAFIAGANPTSTSVNDGQLRLAADGTLGLFANNAQVGFSSAALSTATWYRIEIHYDNSPASGSKVIRAYIDGTEFAGTATSSNVGGTTNGIAVGANLGAEAQTTGNWFFDDVAVNDSTGSFQTGLPGSGKVVAIWPNAAGDSNQWLDTAGSAGTSNNYTLVDETNPNDGTDFVQSSTLNDLDLYNFAASGLAAADTVNVVHVHLRRRNATADATTAVNVVVVKTSGGTQANGTAVIPNNVNWRTGSVNSATVILPNYTGYQDPDAAAWTSSTLDTMQAGPKLTAFGTNGIQVSTVWATVDYNPATTVTPATIACTAAMPAPTVAAGSTATPAAVTATAALPAATLSTGATTSPAVVTATGSLPAVTLAAGSTATPAAVATVATLPAATASAGSTATPAAVAAIAALPAPTVSAGGSATATPATIAATATLPTASPSAGSTTTPAAVASTVALPASTASAGSTPTPATIAATVAAPAATVSAGSTTTPSAVAATAAVPAATLSAGSTVQPATIAAVASLPAAGTSTGATATPATVATTAALPAPTVSAGGSVTVTPDAISAAVTAPAVSLAVGSTVAPAVIAATVALPAASASAGATATPGSIAAVVALLRPLAGTLRATSSPTVTAGRTSTSAVSAGRTSVPTVTVGYTSAPTVGG